MTCRRAQYRQHGIQRSFEGWGLGVLGKEEREEDEDEVRK